MTEEVQEVEVPNETTKTEPIFDKPFLKAARAIAGLPVELQIRILMAIAELHGVRLVRQ